MKKRIQTPIRLSKETLRNLSLRELGLAVGGAPTVGTMCCDDNSDYCTDSCPSCPCTDGCTFTTSGC